MVCKFQVVTKDFFLLWNEISVELESVSQKNLLTQALLFTLLNHSQSFFDSLASEWKKGIVTNEHVLLCKAADLNRTFSEMGVCSQCSDSNGMAKQLQIAMSKSFETISGIILNQSQILNQNLQLNLVANKCKILKAM